MIIWPSLAEFSSSKNPPNSLLFWNQPKPEVLIETTTGIAEVSVTEPVKRRQSSRVQYAEPPKKMQKTEESMITPQSAGRGRYDARTESAPREIVDHSMVEPISPIKQKPPIQRSLIEYENPNEPKSSGSQQRKPKNNKLPAAASKQQQTKNKQAASAPLFPTESIEEAEYAKKPKKKSAKSKAWFESMYGSKDSAQKDSAGSEEQDAAASLVLSTHFPSKKSFTVCRNLVLRGLCKRAQCFFNHETDKIPCVWKELKGFCKHRNCVFFHPTKKLDSELDRINFIQAWKPFLTFSEPLAEIETQTVTKHPWCSLYLRNEVDERLLLF
jgi:hypothetical protein